VIKFVNFRFALFTPTSRRLLASGGRRGGGLAAPPHLGWGKGCVGQSVDLLVKGLDLESIIPLRVIRSGSLIAIVRSRFDAGSIKSAP
jgi:hypothetical protein